MVADVNLPALQLQVGVVFVFFVVVVFFFFCLFLQCIQKVNLSTIMQVAMGLPLHCIKDIRALYKKDLWGTTPIDFDK